MGLLLLGLLACNDFALEEVAEEPVAGLRSLEAEPGELDFGVREGPAAVAEVVTLVSSGDEPVTVTSLDLTGSSAYTLTWAGTPTRLDPGQTTEVLVTFSPQSVSDEAVLSVRSDGVDPVLTVPLRGAGSFPALRVEPSLLSFQSDYGESVTLPATLHSFGTSDAVISTYVVDGAPFTATMDSPVTLAPGESTTISVTYRPTAEEETVTGTVWFGVNTAAGFLTLPLEAHRGPVCVGLGEAWDRGFLSADTNFATTFVLGNLSDTDDICIDQWYVFRAEHSQDLGAGDMEYDLGGEFPDGTLRLPPGTSLDFPAAAPGDTSWWCLEDAQYTEPNRPYTFTGARVFDPLVGDMTSQDQGGVWDHQESEMVLMAGRDTNYVEVPGAGGSVAVGIRVFNMGSWSGTGEIRETIPAGWSASGFSESPRRTETNADFSTTFVFEADFQSRVRGSGYEDTWYDEHVITYTLTNLPCSGRQYLPPLETRWEDHDGTPRVGTANPLVVNCRG